MRDSEVLQFIVEELEASPIVWEDNKDLFELICYPLSFGTENEKLRNKAKRAILHYFQDVLSFDQKRFSDLFREITCTPEEEERRKALLDFLLQSYPDASEQTLAELQKLTDDIPCRDPHVKNYRSKFHHWLTHICDIKDMKVKQHIQDNFEFQPKLWGGSDGYQKEILRHSIQSFIKRHTMPTLEIRFEEIDETFGLQETLSEQELRDLETVTGLNKAQTEAYIRHNSPLSQLFILKLIPILYRKGYYKLLLDACIEKLKPYYYNDKNIQIIHANVLGSAQIRRYKEAYYVIKNIDNHDDDQELIDLQTIAISNIRRYMLGNARESAETQKEIIHELIKHYDKIFRYKEAYHYYPGINLAYLTAIAHLAEGHETKAVEAVREIYTPAKRSLSHEKNSPDPTTRYYAHMSEIEFQLLQNHTTALSSLHLFLDNPDQKLPLIELERTHRQMLFFVQTVRNFTETELESVKKVQKAIRNIEHAAEKIN